jgi:hypothetical protein
LDKEQRELIKKAAHKMRQLHEQNKSHEKRAHALRLIYKQAELGHEELPQTHKDMEEKIASLLNQDLKVIEKALDMFGSNVKLGELGNTDFSIARNAEETFQASVLGETY